MPCASAFLTSDCEIPNCLAIADGLTPALKAARTAFSLPVVNEPAPSSAASWRRCGFASATRFSFAGLGGRRPRRSASVVTAASSASISTSSNRFSAPARSCGKKWRCCEARLSGPALPLETAGTEKRSGVVSAGRRVGIPQLCRRWLTAATACRATAGTHQHMRPWRATRPASWSQARRATKEANLIQVAPRDDCRRLKSRFSCCSIFAGSSAIRSNFTVRAFGCGGFDAPERQQDYSRAPRWWRRGNPSTAILFRSPRPAF